MSLFSIHLSLYQRPKAPGSFFAYIAFSFVCLLLLHYFLLLDFTYTPIHSSTFHDGSAQQSSLNLPLR